jgi:nucleotide-binding universal stress UspA family protein
MKQSPELWHPAPAGRCRHPILAGYGGSLPSRRALAYAAGLARRADRWLLIVRTWRLGSLVPAPLTRDAQTERVRQLRADLAETDLTRLDVEIIVRLGDPAAELLKMAADRRADAIVIGAAPRFRRLAGVPARLARRACCPAVVVP